MKDNEGDTLLHYAAVGDSVEIIEMLVKGNGGSVGIKDEVDLTS